MNKDYYSKGTSKRLVK